MKNNAKVSSLAKSLLQKAGIQAHKAPVAMNTLPMSAITASKRSHKYAGK